MLRSSYLPKKRIRKGKICDSQQRIHNSADQTQCKNFFMRSREVRWGVSRVSKVSKREMEHRERARRPEDADVAKEAE
jgi:hypothetical protein